MHKRLAIGAIALLVIGAAAYVFSQRRKGSLEYHKREYLKAGVPVWALAKGVPSMVRGFSERRFVREVEFHKGALIDAGYLKKRVFAISNTRPISVMHTVSSELPKNVSEFTSFSWMFLAWNAYRNCAK